MSSVDFTKFSKDGKDTRGSTKPVDKRWWLAPLEDRALAVVRVVGMLIQADTVRQMQYQLSARLYGNLELIGVNGLGKSKAQTLPAQRDRSYFNVIQSGVDTLVSKQAKNKPKPLFLTSGGSWKIQRKAKKLDQFVEGIFYENEIDKLRNQIRRDAYVFGDGLVQVFANYERVKFERVLPTELYVDWLEAISGRPLQLHRVRNMDRDVLCDLFKDDPKKVELIKDANSASAALTGSYQNVADQVTVIESWRLPSGPDAGDGIHSINLVNAGQDSDLSGQNLLDEEWKKAFFPFAKRQWCRRLYGHWSQGIPEQVQGQQLQLNKMSWVEQRAYHLAGAFKVWMKTGSKIPKEHINNDIGAIITGEEPPQYLVVPPLPPGFEEKRVTIKNEVFEQIGISQLSAVSQKPAGLDSGKALREYNNIESDRFTSDGQDEEQFILDLAKLTVDCAKEIAESNKGHYKSRVPGKKFIQTIDWKDIDLEEDEYFLKIFPVSSLPQDPAGRLQTIQEYIQAGMIDPITGRRLLDFPDLEQHESLANAMEDWINSVLEKIVDGDGSDETLTPPDPAMKLDLAKWFCLMYYAQGQANGLEEKQLDLLRAWNTQVDALIAKSQAPAPGMGPQAGPPGAGQPLASPMAQPQSSMVPNVPQPQGAMA